MLKWLDHCSKLSTEQKNILEAYITISEVKNAIKKLKSESLPGTDGLPIIFYKKYHDILSALLSLLFNNFIKNGIMSHNMRKAKIALLGKQPDGNNVTVNDWRPISVLNSDYKILAKVIYDQIE